MTRRVALASIAVVCVVMLLLGGALYLRFAHDLHVSAALIRAPFRRELAQITNHATLVRLRRELIIGSVLGALVAANRNRRGDPARARSRSRTADVADRIARTSDLRARVPAAPGNDELARLTTSMNRMLDRVEASDGALRRLVGDASHELRTPITSLRGNLELLSSATPVTESDHDAALADARTDAERLGDLVEDLLALARADAAPELAPLTLDSLLSELPSEQVTISPEARTATVAGDRAALHSALRNLAANADRYAGGWTLTATVDQLRVVDNGPGIAPEERARVFERFARGGAAAGSDGSGIGLAIVDAVTHAHGGSVAIEDTPGGGATFVIQLPLVGGG